MYGNLKKLPMKVSFMKKYEKLGIKIGKCIVVWTFNNRKINNNCAIESWC